MAGRPETAVGCVVIGRNEGDRLVRCLHELRSQCDVSIYVDSGSTDRSVEVARSAGARVIELGRDAPFTAARGRNAGFAALRENHPECAFVQFIDGDCVIATNWIRKGLAFLQKHERAAAVCGRRFEADPDSSAYIRMCDDEWDTPVGRTQACGGDAMMRVAAFEQVGGFRSLLAAGEEPELCARLRENGWEIWRIDEPMTEHDAAMHNFAQFWLRATRGGYGYAQVWTVTRGSAHPLYARQLRSAAFWVLAVPILILAVALLANSAALLLLLPIAYALQVSAIAARKGASDPQSWFSAAMLMVGKIAELIGAFRFFLRPRRTALIEYKSQPDAG